MPKLQLEWSERNIFQSYGGLNFSSKFELSENRLYCAEFDPRVKVGDEFLKYIHFTDFIFFGDGISFTAAVNVSIDLPADLETLKLSIISPEAIPPLKLMNTPLQNADEKCFVHLFYYSQPNPKERQTEKPLKFLSTLTSNWSSLHDEIDHFLTEQKYGDFGRSIGIVQKAHIYPKLVRLSTFFKDPESYKTGSKIMILIASSFDEFTLAFRQRNISSANVPFIPKDLIYRIINQYPPTEKFTKNVRRLLKALFNGGIPVNLFEKEPYLMFKQTTSGNKEYFKKDDFERTTLNLEVDPLINYLEILKGPLDNMKYHHFQDSNEVTLRSLFWDQVISIFFQFDLLGKQKHFNLSSEWRTRNLVRSLEDRRIDIEASIRPNLVPHPIYQCQIRTESFYGDQTHKDYSKLVGSLSLTCNSLARDLADNGKDPCLARTYGTLIGGTTVQHLVAHPVVTPVENGQFEIHSHVTCEDEWKFDILSRQNTNKRFSPTAEAESLLSGKIDLSSFTYSRQIQVSQDIYIDEESSDIDSEIDCEEIVNQAQDASVGNLYSNHVDVVALAKFHSFIRIVLARINKIISAPTLEQGNQKKVKPQGIYGLIGAARPGTISETPDSDRANEGVATIETETSDSPTSTFSKNKSKKGKRSVFVVSKKFSNEDEILRKLSIFPDSFPNIFNSAVDENSPGFIKYELEYLKPLIYKYQVISDMINAPFLIDCLFACISFGVQTLYSLYLLHDILGIIHTNIKPENIMFSELSGSWKFIDFSRCVKVQSPFLQTLNLTSSNEFIDPETRANGVCTKQADIYSLGLVMTVCLLPILTFKILDMEEGHTKFDPKLKQIYHRFAMAIQAIRNFDPDNRPSVLKSLSSMFDLLEYFEYKEPERIYSAVKIIVQQQKQIPLEIETEMLKKSSISTEKEPLLSIIPQIE